MDKGTKQLLLAGGAIICAYFVYNKFISKRVEYKAYTGEVNDCEEMAMSMRFQSPEDKAGWISNCVKGKAPSA